MHRVMVGRWQETHRPILVGSNRVEGSEGPLCHRVIHITSRSTAVLGNIAAKMDASVHYRLSRLVNVLRQGRRELTVCQIAVVIDLRLRLRTRRVHGGDEKYIARLRSFKYIERIPQQAALLAVNKEGLLCSALNRMTIRKQEQCAMVAQGHTSRTGVERG